MKTTTDIIKDVNERDINDMSFFPNPPVNAEPGRGVPLASIGLSGIGGEYQREVFE